MKRKERTHNIEDTHYACNEQMERLGADTPCCICFGHKCKQLKTIPKPQEKCDACKPREHGIVIVEKVEEGGRCIQCRRIVCSPKPTEKNEHKCSKAYGNDCFYCGRDMTKPTKVEIKEIKTNPINEHTDINIVVIVNKLNEVIREINKLLSH